MTDQGSTWRRVFESLLEVWSGGDVDAVLDLVTDDYVGHMMHLNSADRRKGAYPAWIAQFLVKNPGAQFRVVEQRELSDGLFSRLEATRADRRGVGPLVGLAPRLIRHLVPGFGSTAHRRR